MAYYDGKAATATEVALEQCCEVCSNRGITVRGGVLLCGTHAWNRAMDNIAALFTGEVFSA